MKKKKEKFLISKKKILLLALVSVPLLVGAMFGINCLLVYASTVTWNGTFQYTDNNFRYDTDSYAVLGWNGESITIDAGTPGTGFKRETVGNKKVLTMDQNQLVPYLRRTGRDVRPGDIISWYADARVDFRYRVDGKLVANNPFNTVGEANGANNTNRDSERRRYELAGVTIVDWDSTGALWFDVIDDDGIRKAYNHHFSDDQYRADLCYPLQTINVTVGYTLTLDADPADGGSAFIKEAPPTSIVNKYMDGDRITVMATANEGYTFVGWEVNGTTETVNPYTFYMPSSNHTITAKFIPDEPKEYKLTVSADPADGGTVEGDSGTITQGNSVTVNAIPAEGYYFSGWTTDWSGFTGSSSSETFSMPGRNVTLVANFVTGEKPPVTPPPATQPPAPPEEDTSVTVSVISSGGGSVSGSGTYEPGDTVTITASPDYGYDFDGWSTSDCSLNYGIWSSYNTFTVPEGIGSITIYGDFSPKGPNTVAYYANYPKGGGPTRYEYTDSFYDQTHTVSDNTFSPPPGYNSFIIWNTRKDGRGNDYAPGDTIYSTGEWFSLYAQWTPITYTVQFAEDSIDVPPILTPPETWTYDAAPPMPEGLSPKQYVVAYDLNRKETMSTTPAFVAEVKEKNTKSVHAFLGWRPYRNLSGEYVQTGMGVVKPLTTQNLTTVQDDHIILFPEWGGESSFVTLPIVNCTGYKFYGWAMDKDETDITKALVAEPSGQKYQPRENCTLYAMLLPKTYPIALDYQNPDLNFTEPIIMTFDAHGPDVTVPKRLHYTFQGYFSQPDGKGIKYYDKNGKSTRLWQVDDGSITTLYAHWVLDTQIIYYRNSGMGYMSDTWLSGNATSVTLPEVLFTKAGYKFSKWTTKKDGSGTSYNNKQTITGIPVSSVISLYAQWEPESYTVSFNPSGGVVSQTSVTVKYDMAYGTLPTPTRSGYRFVDWYTSDTNELVRAGTIVTKMENHELKAKWEPIGYTVTFDWNFDYERTGVNTKTGWEGTTKDVIYDSTYGSLPSPSKEGYTFLGWYTSESSGNGSGTAITSSTAVKTAGAHTLYARWLNKEYLLNFDYNLDYRVDPNN